MVERPVSILNRRALGDTPYNLIPSRLGNRTGSVNVTSDTALRTSAVWAALRLRADIISSLPIDVFRRVAGMQIEVPKPAVLINPGGQHVDMTEWMYSTQIDLDRVGNAFGIITEKDGSGNPRVIQLVKHELVTVRVKDGVISYRVDHKNYPAEEIWHEKQYTVPGLAVGLSPVSYAAWTIGQYQSAQDFGLSWFSSGGTIPSGHLKNTTKTVQAAEADKIKRRFKLAVESSDVFVTGKDWEYTTMNVAANEGQFIETQKFGLSDIGRFFGVPADLIDAAPVGKSSVTYANITQRNLQFLILNLGPAINRREKALSRILPQPRYVKLNTDALLRMDPDTRNSMILARVGKTMTANEARELDNLPPFTPAQIAEMREMATIGTAPAADATSTDGTTQE